MTKLLLVLLLALTSCTTHAHDTAAQLSHMVRSRIETHTRERLKFKSAREYKEANVGSKSTSRQLQAPVIGRTLLIHAEYQLQQLDPGTASYVQSIVGAAIQNVQSYLSLNTTSPPSPLLVTPVTYSQNACINANLETYLTGKNCSSPGYSPDFNASLPVADVRSPYCGPAKLNQSHILSESCLTGKGCQISDAGGPGLVTDYYLYVTSDVSGSCSANLGSGSATAAFGIPCFFDNYVGRPILGAFNICPIAFQVYTTSARLINVITHEMLHALGFNNALFPWFSSATDGTSDQIMQSIPASSTLKAAGMRNDYLVMISPTVKREARAQFNCPSLVGAALEDQGGSGSVGSHWENELFQGDLMAPTDASDASPPRISRMTLAFFEDSGWYIGNWTISSYLDWGRNEGCDFAQLTSNAYAARYPTQPYFCTAPTQPSDNLCTFNGLSHGFCYQSIFSTLGLVTTVSSSPNSIGLRYVRAYCISPWIYNNTVGNPAFDAALSSNIGWTIGPNARCLQIQGLVEGGLMLNVAINTCINAVCDQSTNALTYSLNNARVVCPNPGSYSSAPITVDLASASGGSISSPAKALCPSDTKSYCRALSCPSSSSSINPCSSAQGGGVCFEGSCVCSFGFTGTNCESRFLPQDLAVLPSLVAPPPSSSISPPPLSQPSAIIGNISPPPLLPRSTSLPPPSPPPPPPPNKNVNSNTQSSSIVTTSTDSKNGLDLFGNGNVAASIVVLVFAGIMVLTVMGLIAFLVVKRMERSKEESKRRNYAETIEVWNNGSTNPTPAYPPPPSWPQNSQYPPRTSSPGSYNYNAWPNPGSPSGAMGGLPPAPSSGLSPHGIPLTVISPYMQPSQPQTPQAQVQGQGQGQGQGGSRPRYVMIPPSGPSPPTRYNY